MAKAPDQSSSLPHYYGERLPDESIVERPVAHSESRDPILRLPLQQPHEAHLHPELNSPGSPIMSAAPAEPSGINPGVPLSRSASKRTAADPNRWVVPYPTPAPMLGPASEAGGMRLEDNNRPRRYEPYYNDYRSRVEERSPRGAPSEYMRERERDDEYYESDAQRPRVYRRPSRRHTRPPVSHSNYNPRYTSRPPGSTRRSMDGYRSSDDYAEPDTPTKPRVVYEYGRYDDSYDGYIPEPGYGGSNYGGDGGGRYGGGRGPPRRRPSEEVLRIPWTMWMNSNAKNHFVAFIGEFVGTALFLFFAFSGTQVANIGSSSSATNTTTGADTGFSPQVLLYIALCFAFSLMVNVWIFFRISGGLFNPAVTFAMLLTRTMSPLRFGLLLIAQLAGSIFASYIVSVLFPTPFNVRTTLSNETSLARGVFIEAILTAELVFTIFMLAKEKHKATFIAPVGIGLSLFIAELVGVYYTGGSLNPARSFGPCVVTGIFDREHWIYWVGPALGALIAVTFYKVIKVLEYEMANPGQDDDDKEREIKEIKEKV